MLSPSDISDLYRRYSASLLRYLAAGTGDLSTAQDLLHEVFRYILENADRIELTPDISGYLYGCARDRMINHLQRCNEMGSSRVLYSDETHGRDANYEDRMEIVRACDELLKLPDLLRRTMYEYIGGRTPSAIAAHDGVKDVAVRVRMHRARRMMVSVQGSEGTF